MGYGRKNPQTIHIDNPNVSDLASQLAEKLTQSDVNDITVLITAFGGIGDGATDNITAYNNAKTASGVNGIVKFPQNAAGNATYWFGTNPDFSNVIIQADEGVILSLPTTGISLKTYKFNSDLQIYWRDRDNTSKVLKTMEEKWTSPLLTGDITKSIGIQKPLPIDATTLSKKSYNISTDAVTTGVCTLPSSNNAHWDINSITGGTNPIDVAQIDNPEIGKEYSASFSATPSNSSARNGILIAYDGGVSLFSIDSSARAFYGVKNTGVAWSETPALTLPSGAYSISATANAIISVRLISKTEVEFYVNGYFVYRKTLTGNLKSVGFGFTGYVTTGGAADVWDFIMADTPEKQTAKYLNLYVVGDSISFGEAVPLDWPSLLKQSLRGLYGIAKVDVTSQAVSGETASMQLSRLQATNVSAYNYVLILVGTNDISSQKTMATFRQNIQDIITKVVGDGSIPILGIPPLYIDKASMGNHGFTTSNYGKGALYRSAIYRIAADNNVLVADILSDFGKIGSDNVQLRDNLHPQTLFMGFIARSFATAILQNEIRKVSKLPTTRTEGTNSVLWLGAMPTGGYFKQGDIVYNTSPSVLGVAGSQYSVLGWRRITTGIGNILNTDWVEMRNLTGS